MTIPELIATICAGLFSGAAVYITLAQQPAVAALDPPSSIVFFRAMYARAAPIQAALAAVGSLAAVSAWWGGRGGLWLLASLLLGSVIPLTLIVIKPTVERLHDSALARIIHESLLRAPIARHLWPCSLLPPRHTVEYACVGRRCAWPDLAHARRSRYANS